MPVPDQAPDVAECVRQVVDRAGELTADLLDALRALLPPVDAPRPPTPGGECADIVTPPVATGGGRPSW